MIKFEYNCMYFTSQFALLKFRQTINIRENNTSKDIIKKKWGYSDYYYISSGYKEKNRFIQYFF